MLRRIHTIALLLLASMPLFAQDVAHMDEVIRSYVPKAFMGSVLVARGSEISLNSGYGLANLEWHLPNTPATKFRIGSITKQFTAASILLLEQRGQLSTDDPISKYLDNAPEAWGKITLFNLLTHTSGIPNHTSFPGYSATKPFPTTPAELIARFRDKRLEFEPGELGRYSNSGYVLLGHVIENLSGLSYSQFVQDNIFTPLGMMDSGYDSNQAIIEQRASGYYPTPSGPINAGSRDPSIGYSAGALFSTTEDLLRWERALFGGKVLSPAALRKMTTPFKYDYAFGLVVHTTDGRKVIDHQGTVDGFDTFLAHFPETDVTVIVLSNINGPAALAIGTALGILAHRDAKLLPQQTVLEGH